jgi:hypothetical protein
LHVECQISDSHTAIEAENPQSALAFLESTGALGDAVSLTPPFSVTAEYCNDFLPAI